MANKKILICAALATGLLVTACVKKEEPKTEDQQEQAVETQQEQAEINVSVDSESQPAVVVEPVIEISREETTNTTTEIRRETRPVQTQPLNNDTAMQTTPKPVTANTGTQSEDDAVAAAIAAATPALGN
ncbi:MAG: internalin [Acinetobacter sp.]|nr:internalin [Acinetobacter sp.]MBP6352714.1 internalin [Acinetobacter sp.]MBP7217458.1 internalin [Acinetobacter sp.]